MMERRTRESVEPVLRHAYGRSLYGSEQPGASALRDDEHIHPVFKTGSVSTVSVETLERSIRTTEHVILTFESLTQESIVRTFRKPRRCSPRSSERSEVIS
jgi:hypothetical protein